MPGPTLDQLDRKSWYLGSVLGILLSSQATLTVHPGWRVTVKVFFVYSYCHRGVSFS
jgi:hypothetical protein